MKPNRKFNPFRSTIKCGLTAAVVMAFSSTFLEATPYYWDIDDAVPDAGGAAPAGTWSSAGMTWSTDSTGSSATPAYTTFVTDDLFFAAGSNASAPYTVTLTTAQNARSLTFEEGTIVIGTANNTGTVNLASGLSNLSANLATVRSGVTVAGNQAWNTGDAGGITTSGLVTINNANTTISRTGAGAGVVTLSGGLTLNSSSGTTMTLAGTTAANTSLAGGTLTFASGASPITVSGTPLTTGNVTNAAASGSGVTQTVANDLSLSAARTFATNTNTNLVISGSVSGSFGLNINPTNNASASYITLSGNNTHTGNTSVGFATLRIGSATALGTGNLTTSNNGHFDNSTGNDGLTLANGFLVTGSGGMYFDGTNSLTFSGASTFAAQMSIDVIGSNSKNLTLTNTTSMTASTTFTVNNSGSFVLGGSVSWGAFQLQKSGTGTLVLSSANTGAGLASNVIATVTYPTTIRINAGTVSIGNSAAFGTGAVDLRGATLLSTSDLGGVNKLTNTIVNATGSPIIGGASNLELGGSYILSNGAGNQTLNINNTASTRISGAVSLTDLTGDNQTLSVNVAGTAGASEISGVIQDTTTGTAVGSFTKSGPGVLTLSAANTYTGGTTISGGTLQLSGTGAINSASGISINGSGAKLLQSSSVASTPAITLTNGTVDGAGTVGAVTAASSFSNTIANGNGTASPLTLSSLTYSGSGAANVTLAGGANTNAPLIVAGALTTSGVASSIVVNATALTPLVAGTTYRLIGYGSFSGNLGDFTKGTFAGLSARQLSFQNDTVNKFITFSYGGIADSLRWTGANAATWAPGLNGTNKNWKLITAGTATDFIQADDVVFDDGPGVVNTSVSITGNVSPATTTFSNSTLNYDFSSPGDAFGISGTGPLVKNGTGSVTLGNPNGYTGGTVLNSGRLNLNNAAAIGTGALTINGGTLDNTRGDFLPVTLSTNNAQIWNGNFAFQGTTALNLGTGVVTLGGNRTVTSNGSAAISVGTITGNFSLTKAGTGNLTVAGLSTFSGGTIVNDGTLALAAGGGTGALRGVVTVNAPGMLALNASNALGFNTGGVSVATLNVNGGTVSNFAGDQGFVTNFNLTGATLTSGGGTYKFTTGFGINSLASDATSIINAPVGIQGTSLVFNTAAGTTSNGIDLGVDGVISGAALVKDGPGVLQLLGATTYTGTTTVTNGKLQVGDGSRGSIGSTSAISVGANGVLGINLATAATLNKAISNSGKVEANGPNVNTFSGVISGAGGFSQSGSGTTNLTAANTYTGETTVLDGNLVLTNANATSNVSINGEMAKLTSAVNLNAPITLSQGTFDGINSVGAIAVGAGNGATLANGNGVSGTLTASAITLGATTKLSLIPLGGASTNVAPLVSTGALAVPATANAITVNVAPASPLQNATYRLIGYNTFTGSIGTFVKGSGFTTRQSVSFANDTVNKFITLTVAGDSPKWTGLNGDGGRWITSANGSNPTGAGNWKLSTSATKTNYYAGDVVLFDDTATGTTTVDIFSSDVAPTGVTFNNSSKAYTLTSRGFSGITGSGTLAKKGSNKLTILTNNTYTGATTISGGTLQIGDGVVDGSIASTSGIFNDGSLVFDMASIDQTYDKAISGTGSLTVKASGGSFARLTLSGTNTFSGGINIANATVLIVDGPNALGTGNTVNFGTNDSDIKTLQLNGNSVSFAGINGDSSAVIGSLGVSPVTLTINGATNSSYGGSLNSSGGNLSLAKSGTGTLTLSGTNAYAGTTGVSAGTLALLSPLGGTGAVNVSGGTLSLQVAGAISGKTINFTGTGALLETADNAITGSSVVNVGSSLSIERPNDYTAQTTVTAANVTLTLNNPLAAGTGKLFTSQANTVFNLLMNGGGTKAMPNGLKNFGGPAITVNVDNNGDTSKDGVIQLNGTSELGDSGTTTLNVTGGNGYSLYLANVTNSTFHNHTDSFNPTTASLAIGAFGSVTNPDRAATLRLDGTNASNTIGNITETAGTPLSLRKDNSSIWTLIGTNTYTGTTTINGGTLQVGNGSTTGTLGTANVVDNATLVFNRSDALEVPNSISGAGAVSKLGTGVITLSGANSYTGETSVDGGTLSIPTAFLSDTAAVRIGAAGTLNLTTGTTDTVGAFYIDGVQQVAGTWGGLNSSAAHKTARITGNGLLNTAATSAYDDWAISNGLTDANNGATQDPDFDGVSNVLEFILGGNPLASDSSILPLQTLTPTDFIFTFNRSDESESEVAARFQYGSTLGGWTDVVIGTASVPADGNGVIVNVNEGVPATNPDIITVSVPRANVVGGKLFGRLKAVK